MNLRSLIGPDGRIRAPSQAEWDRLSPEERREVVAALPEDLPKSEMAPPEGDAHLDARIDARDTLKRYFRDRKRAAYVGSDMAVYYPEQDMFAPDLFVVLDVPDHTRSTWVVSQEGRGLNFALEVYVSGRKKKDAERNVAFYASLGISEYVMYDRPQQRLFGFVLSEGSHVYRRMMPQHGQLHSDVLDLDLSIENERLCFSYAGAILPGTPELIKRLQDKVDLVQQRADAEAERAAEAQARAEQEQAAAAEAQARAAEQRARADAAEQRLRELEELLKKQGR